MFYFSLELNFFLYYKIKVRKELNKQKLFFDKHFFRMSSYELILCFRQTFEKLYVKLEKLSFVNSSSP